MNALGTLFVYTAALASHAAPLPAHKICLKPNVAISGASIKTATSILEGYASRRGIRFVFKCDQSRDRITIAFAAEPPPDAPDALGAIRTAGGSLVPEITVFYGPIRRMLAGEPAPNEGRAFANVIVHEISHWLRNDPRHRPGSEDDQYLTPNRLNGGPAR